MQRQASTSTKIQHCATANQHLVKGLITNDFYHLFFLFEWPEALRSFELCRLYVLDVRALKKSFSGEIIHEQRKYNISQTSARKSKIFFKSTTKWFCVLVVVWCYIPGVGGDGSGCTTRKASLWESRLGLAARYRRIREANQPSLDQRFSRSL